MERVSRHLLASILHLHNPVQCSIAWGCCLFYPKVFQNPITKVSFQHHAFCFLKSKINRRVGA